MKRFILILFTSALTAVVIAFCVVLKYGNVELRIVEPGKSAQVNENQQETIISGLSELCPNLHLCIDTDIMKFVVKVK